MARDAGRALGAALCRPLERFTGTAALESMESRSWASATFAGARHRLAIRLEGEGAGAAAARFLDGLSERDIPLPGHVVADIALLSEARRDDGCWARIELEALTVEAG